MKQVLWVFLILLSGLAKTAGATALDYQPFCQLPVMEAGRIKPLDSLARIELKRIAGNSSLESRSACEWLAELFFTPSTAMQEPLFSVSSAQAAAMLGLPERADRRYSFAELAAVLPQHAGVVADLARKDRSVLSKEQSGVLRLYNASDDFAELIGTFSLLLPLNIEDKELRAELHLVASGPLTLFDDLQKNRQILEGDFQALLKRKGSSVGTYTLKERELAKVAARFFLQESLDKDNRLVRIIPPAWGREEWLSPWNVFTSSSGSPESALLLRQWRAAADAYRQQDAGAWNAEVKTLLAESRAALPPFAAFRVQLEYVYSALNLLLVAAVCYGLGLALAMAGVLGRSPKMLALGQFGLLIGLAVHATALILRMVILMRPPVSTLYESMIFVSFVVMAASCWLGLRRQNYPASITAGLTALCLLLMSWVFAGDSDTLGVLVAVLNTNFWLATHVVCITTGYATALLTGAIAHLYLFRRAINGRSEAQVKSLFALLYRSALVALLFTSVGTMLGGIWADQSWGRFWGWDPKENGALLIVLWLIWLLHGRIAGQLGTFSFAALMALINIVVGLAWVGVNLLSVGLHSYGFTDTAATGLTAFCAVELTFVTAMLIARHLRRNHRADEAKASNSA